MRWSWLVRRRFKWPRGLREAGLAVAVALGIAAPSAVQNTPVIRALETISLDLRFRLRGVKPAEPDTVVVLVDDRSLAALGRWPLSRHLYATAVQRLDAAGARVIAFDLLFPEPEQPLTPALSDALWATLRALPEGADPQLRTALAQFAGDQPDQDLAVALKASGRVLLPLAFSFQGNEAEEPPVLADQVYQKLEPSQHEPFFPLQPKQPIMPIAPLAAAAAGLGHVSIAFDRDGEPRYDYVALPFSGDFVPSLPIRLVAAYRGVKWSDVGLSLGDGVKIGDIVVPTDPAMRLAVNYRGPQGTIPTYSFVDLLQGRLNRALFNGKIVLIGASFIGNLDSYPGPFGNTPIPGTERIANITDMILARDFLRDEPPPWPDLVLALVAALALGIGVAGAFLPTRYAALAGGVPVFGWAAGAQFAFVQGLWLPLVVPVAALTAATGAVALFRYGFVDQQRRFIQNAFRRYLSPELVTLLAANPERLRLGGETRMLTIMFSDIRGFTSISEQFKADPEGLSRLINRGFLTPMSQLIKARQGTIDKYMGDCIMAFWNAPLDDAAHAEHACANALAMLVELDRINANLAKEAEVAGRAPQPIHIGVGLNTGECVVGNMGSDDHFAYTAMGDAVNLASRLEGQSKTYGVSLIIGETTREAAPSFAAIELDLIAVKGKAEAVRIFTLLGDAELAQSRDFQALNEDHAAMLAGYRAQDWPAARAALARCRGRDPRLAGVYELYEERLAYFTDHPPAADWDGVFVALTK